MTRSRHIALKVSLARAGCRANLVALRIRFAQAPCKMERDLGERATRRLRELVRAGRLDFRYLPCSCQPGTEGTQACNYKRRCGTLKANGRDVGYILIAERLAVPFQCGATTCPPTPRPWCGSP